MIHNKWCKNVSFKIDCVNKGIQQRWIATKTEDDSIILLVIVASGVTNFLGILSKSRR